MLFRSQKQQLELLVEAAAAQMRPKESVRIKALLEEFQGRAALLAPAKLDLAAGHFERSIALNPQPGNTSVCPLYKTYRQLNVQASADDLLSRFDGKICD